MCFFYVQDSLHLACWLNTPLRQGFLCGHRSPLPGIAIHLPGAEMATAGYITRDAAFIIKAPQAQPRAELPKTSNRITPVDTCAIHVRCMCDACAMHRHDLSLRHPPPTIPPVFGSPGRAKHLRVTCHPRGFGLKWSWTNHQHATSSLTLGKHGITPCETMWNCHVPPMLLPKRLNIWRWLPLRSFEEWLGYGSFCWEPSKSLKHSDTVTKRSSLSYDIAVILWTSSLRYPGMKVVRVRRIIGVMAVSCLSKQLECVII